MENTMAWIWLIIAGLFEITWAVGLKYTQGFTRPWPSLFVLAMMAVSFYLLSQSLKEIPVGTAYAVWTGIGAAGTALVGILAFHEPAHGLRLACIFMILAGVAGLKVAQ
jgi:quaternary ammonium compound-resistance protein SugE